MRVREPQEISLPMGSSLKTVAAVVGLM
jgi:hypothetical protein